MRYIALFVFFIISQSSFAQDTAAYQNAIKSFQENFNVQNVDAVFDLYTTEMQEAMTKEGVSRFVNGCFEQFGILKTISFVETAEGVNTYNAEFEKTTLIIELQLSESNKISTIQLLEL
ncbi:DUF3887 domain-containing protein [Aquimarina pacifica]|uniref:DUF3887 domain-containing protein n=1 Tax=Aquimarina pacifica TaxID=1296415 RepID=UPI0004722E20|nr:DUF3887 domain-containing protein [Aquimarina pacifica]